MKRIANIFASLILIFSVFGCDDGRQSASDSPVVPMPSPPISQMFPIFVDFQSVPDGFIVGQDTVGEVKIEGQNALVQSGEIVLAPGSLLVTAPANFSLAAILVEEASGYSNTTIEGLNVDDQILTVRYSSAPGNAYYIRLEAPANMMRKIRITAVNATIKKLILARPFDTLTFNALPDITSTFAIAKIKTGDFNGDNKTDLAFADGALGKVSVLYSGTIAGDFSTTYAFDASGAIKDIEVADVDMDGKDDILVLSAGVEVYLSNGNAFVASGNFGAGLTVSDIASGDLDGDTAPDLVLGGSGGVHALFNSGAGAFGAPLSVSASSAKAIAVADMNGDLSNDVVIATLSPDAIDIEINVASGSFFSLFASYPLTAAPKSIGVAKFDWDDYPDVAVSMDGNPDLQTFINFGDGSLLYYQAFTATGGAAVDLAMRDLNNDGFADMVIADAGINELAVFLSGFDGLFTISKNIGLSGIPAALAVEDINKDGKSDIIPAFSPNRARVYENTSR